MKVSKIHLSAAEESLMQNADVILTKNVILQKVRTLFESVQEAQADYAKAENLEQNPVFAVGAKISRGENYEGLPYLILDYPRYSARTEFVFIRSFFWWGHFFSSTLQVAGKSKDGVADNISRNWADLMQKGYSLGIHVDPWVHHFEKSNYRPLTDITPDQWKALIIKQEFIKIAISWPLKRWPEAGDLLFESWKQFQGIIPKGGGI